jgi:F0F1-type ATP synthase assembly protein I
VTHAQPSQPNKTYGDGLSIAFELVATPAIVALIGFGIDRWLGTTPLFTIALSMLAVGTVVGLTIWRYGLEMDRVEAERRAVRTAAGRRAARWEQDRPERRFTVDADPAPGTGAMA